MRDSSTLRSMSNSQTYHPRHVDGLIDQLLGELPALLLTGPRATGKTTTAIRYARSVVRLDREAEAAAFRADPDAALRSLEEPVLLDEWRVVPGVLGALKRSVDAAPRPNRFIVTGSVCADLEGETWPGTDRLKRLVRLPKRYITDPALIGAALRIDAKGVLRDGNLLGRFLDTFVAAQLRAELHSAARDLASFIFVRRGAVTKWICSQSARAMASLPSK